MLFLKTIHQKGLFGQIKKKVEFLLLSPDSRKLLTTSQYHREIESVDKALKQ